MDSLLAALEAVPRRRRRLAVAAVVAPLAGLLVVAGRASDDGDEPAVDPCAEVGSILDATWNDERSGALRRTFEATSLPFAESSADTVQEALDDWRERWQWQRGHLCLATVERQRPDEVLGLRGACLERQRRRFEATVDVLLDGDPQVVTRAKEQVAQLPEPLHCGDDERLLLGVRPPTAEQAEAVTELRRALARSQAERLAGHTEQAEHLAMPALATAEQLGYRPVLAEALAEAGELAFVRGDHDQGVSLLERAVDLAEATHHDHLSARVWRDLATRTLHARDVQRGKSQLRRAESANERIGKSPLLDSRLEFLHGELAQLSGNLEQAEAAFRAALELLDAVDDQGAALLRPRYLAHLATVIASDGRQKESLALRYQAMSAAETGFGPGHPEVAAHVFSLGQALQAAGRTKEAIVYLQQAASMWRSSPDTPDPELGIALLSLVHVALEAGELAQAERHALEADAILSRSLPAGRKEHGDVSMTLGVVADWRGDLEAAFEAFEQAVIRYERSPGVQTSIIADARVNAALALLQLERLDEAKARFDAALASGPSESHVPMARLALAVIALHEGDPDAARAQLDAMTEYGARFDDIELSEYEFLDKLTRLRRTRHAQRFSDRLLAAFREPTHELYEALRWLVRLTETTDAEQRRLGLDPDHP
jgi:tetratricopeptide (TPR) repeat protein